jgi:hypothetical protein
VLWYGVKQNSYNNIIKKIKKKSNKLSVVYSRNIEKLVQVNKQTFYVYKPSGWDAVILKNNSNCSQIIFFCSNSYFFKIGIPRSVPKVLFDPNASVFILHTGYINNSYRLFLKHIDSVFTAFYRPYFRKIKFKGKGYYIYKNKRNTITPQFGYSHRLYVYSYFVSVRFLSKTTIFVFGLLKTDIITTSLAIKAMRPINIFTGRGVRFSRQVIYKKVGKVSSYR